MSQNNLPKLIHIGKYQVSKQGFRKLFLRQLAARRYAWFEEREKEEKQTEVEASTAEEAMRLAHKTWKHHAFRTIICGFRYTLPERDEHGMNALFHQMAASYKSPNGVYFDEEVGHHCFVQNASKEALEILKQLEDSHTR